MALLTYTGLSQVSGTLFIENNFNSFFYGSYSFIESVFKLRCLRFLNSWQNSRAGKSSNAKTSH